MRMRISLVVFLYLSILYFPIKAYAETAMLSNGQVLDAVFDSKLNNKKIVCGGKINDQYVTGRTVALSNYTLFVPLSDDLKTTKAKLKSAKSAALKKKLQAKITKLKLRIKNENKICSAGPENNPGTSPGTQPTSAPTPSSPTNTPAPTATPVISGNFDSSGNVTSAGKIKFGIPSNLNANISSGRSIWNQTCAGCHSSEKTGRSFSIYKSAIRGDPMFILDKTDQDIANLTAYLRRFETN